MFILQHFLGWNELTNSYDVNIGIGLASTRNIPTGNKVVYFCGEVLDVSSREYIERMDRVEHE